MAKLLVKVTPDIERETIEATAKKYGIEILEEPEPSKFLIEIPWHIPISLAINTILKQPGVLYVAPPEEATITVAAEDTKRKWLYIGLTILALISFSSKKKV